MYVNTPALKFSPGYFPGCNPQHPLKEIVAKEEGVLKTDPVMKKL